MEEIATTNPIDDMSREQKFQMLERLLEQGIEKLCLFARDHNHLAFPFGQNPDPTPLISEEDFVKSGAIDCEDEEPVFQYEYGFDPVKFVADFLLWAHPDSVQTRRNNKLLAANFLRRRVAHARLQLSTQITLQQKVHDLMSGIHYGPLSLITSASSTSIRCVIQPFKPAIVYLQLSETVDFNPSATVRLLRVYCRPDRSNMGSVVQAVDVDKLPSGRLFFLRVAAILRPLSTPDTNDDSDNSFFPVVKGRGDISDLFSEDDDYEMAMGELSLYGDSRRGSCWTLPATDNTATHPPAIGNNGHGHPHEEVATMRVFGQLPLSSAVLVSEESKEANDDGQNHSSCPTMTILTGDLLLHHHHSNPNHDNSEGGGTVSSSSSDLQSYSQQLSSLLSRPHISRLLNHHGPSLLAYRDSHPFAAQQLRLEEVAFKQFRHELRKYNKKHGIAEEGSKDNKNSKGGGSNSNKNSKASLLQPSSSNTHLPPPPVLKPPPACPQLSALLHAIPLPPAIHPPQSSQQLYRAIPFGSDCLVIALDLRRGHSIKSAAVDYLGKEQAEWLSHILKTSVAAWKIIVCGKAMGCAAFTLDDDNEKNNDNGSDSQLQEEEAEADPAALALAEGGGGGGGGEGSQPGSVQMSRAASLEALDQPNNKEKVKQVQVNSNNSSSNHHHSHHGHGHGHHSGGLYEELDETFGRSKYSLLHVLANQQTRDLQQLQVAAGGAASMAAAAITALTPHSPHSPPHTPALGQHSSHSGHHVQHLTIASGIVILSGGVASSVSQALIPLEYPPDDSIAEGTGVAVGAAQEEGKGGELQQQEAQQMVMMETIVTGVDDTTAPLFVAAYGMLNDSSLLDPQTSLVDCDSLATAPPTAAASQSKPPVVKLSVTTATSNASSIPNASSSLSPYGSQLPYCVEVSLGSGAVDPSSFSFLPGLRARAVCLPSSANGSQEEEEEGLWSSCELSILSDGRLSLHGRRQSLGGSQQQAESAVFHCLLSLPTAPDDNDSQSSASVHVA